MAIDGDALIERFRVLEIEATLSAPSPPTGCDAVAQFLWTGESFPYWTNRLDRVEITEDEDSEDFDVYTVDAIGRLVIGHQTEAMYSGVVDANLNLWTFHITQYFNERGMLQSVTYPTVMDSLEHARCLGSNGLRIFPNSGVDAQQVGTEFRFRCELRERLVQQYL